MTDKTNGSEAGLYACIECQFTAPADKEIPECPDCGGALEQLAGKQRPAFILTVGIDAASVYDCGDYGELIPLIEQSIDETQLYFLHMLGEVFDNDTLREMLVFPHSRHSALRDMMDDMENFGWSVIKWDLDTDEELWFCHLKRLAEGSPVVIADGSMAADRGEIEEHGYSREGALTAAWVRMRDIENLAAK